MNHSQRFLTLKDYSANSMFLGKTGICQFISLNFQIIQDQFPWFLPGGKTAPMFRQGNLFKIFHFPRCVRQSLPGS